MARANDILATVTRERTRTLAPFMFFALGFFVVARPLGLPHPTYVYGIGYAILVVLAGLSYGFWTRRIPLDKAELAAAATLWCVNIATLVPMYASGTNVLVPFLITQVAWAGILMHTRYMVATVVAIDAATFPLIHMNGGPYVHIFTSALVCATVFAPLIHSLIRSTLIQLERHREAYESLVETSPDPMFVYNRETLEIRWVNLKMIELLGYDSADQIVGMRSLDLFVHADDRDRLQAHREAVRLGHAASGIDVRWLGADGSVHYVHATSRPVSFGGIL